MNAAVLGTSAKTVGGGLVLRHLVQRLVVEPDLRPLRNSGRHLGEWPARVECFARAVAAQKRPEFSPRGR